MDYSKLLQETPELQLENDSFKQMLAQIKLKPAIDTLSISAQIKDVLLSASIMYDTYDRATKLSQLPDSQNQIIPLIYKSNLYMGKTISNLLELMVLCNMVYDDVRNFYDVLLDRLKLGATYFFEERMIDTIMGYARYVNIMDMVYNNPAINLRPKNLPGDVDDQFMKAGRILNPDIIYILSVDLWRMTKALSMMLNMLDSGNTKPDNQFHHELMEAWLRLTKALDLIGHNWDSVGRVFSVYQQYKSNPNNYETNK